MFVVVSAELWAINSSGLLSRSSFSLCPDRAVSKMHVSIAKKRSSNLAIRSPSRSPPYGAAAIGGFKALGRRRMRSSFKDDESKRSACPPKVGAATGGDSATSGVTLPAKQQSTASRLCAKFSSGCAWAPRILAAARMRFAKGECPSRVRRVVIAPIVFKPKRHATESTAS